MGRAKEVQAEIAFALAREEEAGTLTRLLAEGKLPLRVTHNDTKLNNVMLDAKTRKALCVIDLDTVMPGLSLYDYGDSIRFGAASAAEDEQDLSKVEMRLDLFETYTKGFLGACPGLTNLERELLPLGAKLMTLECGMPDGQYTLGGQDVFLKDGIARLADGTIAGSASNLYDCMRKAIDFGIPKEQAILSATLIPARQLGRDGEIGSIAVGKRADFVVCDGQLLRQAVYMFGEKVQ